MYKVDDFMSFDIDFKKMILHDISIPISFIDKFEEVLDSLNTEEIEYLYYRYQYELKIKEIANIFNLTEDKISSNLKKVLQKFGKTYRIILLNYIRNPIDKKNKRNTTIYFNLLSVYDSNKQCFSSESDIILDTLCKKGFKFMYFNYSGFKKEELIKIEKFFGKRAEKMFYDFDILNPPDLIIDIDRENFMLRDFPNIILPKYDFGTKSKNWSSYFSLV